MWSFSFSLGAKAASRKPRRSDKLAYFVLEDRPLLTKDSEMKRPNYLIRSLCLRGGMVFLFAAAFMLTTARPTLAQSAVNILQLADSLTGLDANGDPATYDFGVGYGVSGYPGVFIADSTISATSISPFSVSGLLTATYNNLYSQLPAQYQSDLTLDTLDSTISFTNSFAQPAIYVGTTDPGGATGWIGGNKACPQQPDLDIPPPSPPEPGKPAPPLTIYGIGNNAIQVKASGAAITAADILNAIQQTAGQGNSEISDDFTWSNWQIINKNNTQYVQISWRNTNGPPGETPTVLIPGIPPGQLIFTTPEPTTSCLLATAAVGLLAFALCKRRAA